MPRGFDRVFVHPWSFNLKRHTGVARGNPHDTARDRQVPIRKGQFQHDLFAPPQPDRCVNPAADTQATAARPEPDSRGVISYPGYQVAVARPGETVESLSQRLGLSAPQVARTNGLPAGSTFRGGEVIVQNNQGQELGALRQSPLGGLVGGMVVVSNPANGKFKSITSSGDLEATTPTEP